MKKLSLKTLILLVLFFGSSTFFSCDREAEKPEIEEFTFENLDLNISIDFTTKLKLSETNLDEIIKEISESIFELEIDNNITHRTNNIESSFIGYDLHFDDEYVTITPISGDENEGKSDDIDCGGNEGDGWKSFGKCYSEACVEQKLKDAGEELADEMGSGQCMDLRVKRNSTNARVCGRVIDC